jgi:hypothetical protein
MGTYCNNTRTDISLYLNKLQQGYLNRTPAFLALMERNGGKVGDSNFTACCEQLGCVVEVNEPGNSLNIKKVSEESKIGWQGGYFEVLAPFAREGSFAEFSCREYGTWRYIKYGDKFIEQEGTVTVQYPSLTAPAGGIKTEAKLTTKRKSVVKAQNPKPRKVKRG